MTEEKLYDTLQQLNLRNLRKHGQNYMASCPSGKHKDARPSWGIAVDEPHLHGCFSCGFRGVLSDLLVRVGGYTVRKAKMVCGEEMADVRTRDLVIEIGAHKQKSRRELKHDEENKIDNEDYLFLYSRSKRTDVYCTAVRGLTLDTVRKANLLWDKKQDRLVIPWYIGNKLVAIVGRALKKSDAKKDKNINYIEGVKKRDLLYLPNREITKEPLVVVEGEMDALKVYASGHHNVAALGHADLSEGQKNLMLNSPCREVWVFTDDDKAGKIAAKRLDAELNKNKLVRHISYAPMYPIYGNKKKLDPARLEIEEISQLLNSLPPLFGGW